MWWARISAYSTTALTCWQQVLSLVANRPVYVCAGSEGNRFLSVEDIGNPFDFSIRQIKMAVSLMPPCRKRRHAARELVRTMWRFWRVVFWLGRRYFPPHLFSQSGAGYSLVGYFHSGNCEGRLLERGHRASVSRCEVFAILGVHYSNDGSIYQQKHWLLVLW